MSDVLRRGWYCPTCHRVFKSTVTKGQNGLGRFHNLACDTPMVKVELRKL